MKNSRRNVVLIIGFVVLTLVGDRIGGHLLSSVFFATKFRFAQIYAGDLPADIAFIGNSRGVHMFHRPPLEEASGQQIANLSFNGMPAELMPTILEDYLEHHKPPKTLFVEVSCVGRENEKGSLERFTVLSSVSPGFCETLRTHNPKRSWATTLSHLYRFNSELMWRSLFFARRSDQDWIMDSVVSEDWQSTFHRDAYRVFTKDQADVDAIKRLILVANRSNVDIRLILAPYLPAYLSQLDSRQAWLKWLSQELDTPITDYSDAIIERDSFADPIHLNPKGAEQLAKLLVQRGDVPKTKDTKKLSTN